MKTNLHFYGPGRTKVRFENILQAFSSRNVDFQSFTTSLINVSRHAGSVVREWLTRDSALGFRSCAADIVMGEERKREDISEKISLLGWIAQISTRCENAGTCSRQTRLNLGEEIIDEVCKISLGK